jgi:hypothetical protein
LYICTITSGSNGPHKLKHMMQVYCIPCEGWEEAEKALPSNVIMYPERGMRTGDKLKKPAFSEPIATECPLLLSHFHIRDVKVWTVGKWVGIESREFPKHLRQQTFGISPHVAKEFFGDYSDTPKYIQLRLEKASQADLIDEDGKPVFGNSVYLSLALRRIAMQEDEANK